MIPLHINEASEEGTSSVHRSNNGKKNLDNFNSWWEEAGHLINYFVCLLIVTLLNNLFYDIAEGKVCHVRPKNQAVKDNKRVGTKDRKSIMIMLLEEYTHIKYGLEATRLLAYW